jgi:hypothetical protein
VIPRTSSRRLVASAALLLALACKGGASEESDTRNDAGTETNASTTTGETATVSGVVSDDTAFAPGAPSVPVAGTNLWLSSDAAGTAPKVYVLGADGVWTYYADAALSGAVFSVDAPAGAYLMLATPKLAAVLPPPAAGTTVGVVVDRASTIGSVLFQAALDGAGRSLVDAKTIDYPSLQEVAALFGTAAKRGQSAPKAAALAGAAELFVQANKDLVTTLVAQGATDAVLHEAFVGGPLKELTVANTVDKAEAGTYVARDAALAMASLPADAGAPSSRQTLSAMAGAGKIDDFRGVVREDVFARAWDSVRETLAGNSKAIIAQAQAAMWTSVKAMTDKSLATATAPTSGAPALDAKTQELVEALQEKKTGGALAAYLEQFCSTVVCSTDLETDDEGDDVDDDGSDDDGTDTDSGGDTPDDDLPGDEEAADDDGSASVQPEPPQNVGIALFGQALHLSWDNGVAAAGVLIVVREQIEPTFVPVDGQVYSLGLNGDNDIIFVGTASDFLDDHVSLGITQHYALFSYSDDRTYSLASTATGTVVSSFRITRTPTIGANTGGISNAPWGDTTNAYLDDDLYANVFLDNSFMLGTSQDLMVYGFDFAAIPPGCTITGLQVKIDRTEVSGYGTDHIKDASVRLVRDMIPVAEDKASPIPWPVDEPDVAVYGGPMDLWGTTWTRAHLNSSGFGVILRTMRVDETDATRGHVDQISVTVDYTIP